MNSSNGMRVLFAHIWNILQDGLTRSTCGLKGQVVLTCR